MLPPPPLKPANRADKHGFTLIELSIVLVIIGLIIGGVMMGRDLIRAAEIRGVVSQIQEYRAAYNTFLIKYNCVPGDCPNYADYGLSRSGSWANGLDGNGLVYSYADGTTYNGKGKFTEYFDALSNMATSGLIKDSAVFYSASYGQVASNRILKTGYGMIFIVSYQPYYPASGNFLLLSNWPSNNTGLNQCGSGIAIDCAVFTVTQSYQIDSKIDDGFPANGGTMATLASGYGVGACRPDAYYGAAYKCPVSFSYDGAIACVNDSVSPATYNLSNPEARGTSYGRGYCALHVQLP